MFFLTLVRKNCRFFVKKKEEKKEENKWIQKKKKKKEELKKGWRFSILFNEESKHLVKTASNFIHSVT